MAEQRLIDANALRERMYHDAFETDTDMQKWDSGCWIRYKMFENAIDDAPTIEERKKGKWARQETDLMYWYECSECGAKPLYDEYRTGRVFSNYCPNCGADMGGEEDD